MKLLKNNKQVGGMQAFILGIVSVAVVLAVGLIVLSELQTAALVGGVAGGATTAASNATGSVLTKLATVPTWIGIIIVVALAFIVLGYFYTR
jgi:hypothetical protein